MPKKFALAIAAALSLTVSTLVAQTAPAPTAGSPAQAAAPAPRGAFPPMVKSPEVHPDRTVTFRLRAPRAENVELVGEVLEGKPPMAMTKADDGVWSITIGPLAPDIWLYEFRVSGVDLPDPGNISVTPRSPGLVATSQVEVPGDGPAFYDARPVPHGQVHMILYESKAMGVDRYMWVYTPPGYDTSKEKYPVYYLLHGNGETQNGWMFSGRANIILDNLIADGKAKPMVIVMPHGHAIQSGMVGPYQAVQQTGPTGMMNFTAFTDELIHQIIPTVEKDFRVYTDADHRAIGGLSMGAFQSIQIGLSHPELFHWVLAYSGGYGGLGPQAPGPIEEQAPWKDLLANSNQTKKNLHLLFLGSGEKETAMHEPGQRLVKLFKDKGINAVWAEYPGGHMFTVWRNDLNFTAPMLFR